MTTTSAQHQCRTKYAAQSPQWQYIPAPRPLGQRGSLAPRRLLGQRRTRGTPQAHAPCLTSSSALHEPRPSSFWEPSFRKFAHLRLQRGACSGAEDAMADLSAPQEIIAECRWPTVPGRAVISWLGAAIAVECRELPLKRAKEMWFWARRPAGASCQLAPHNLFSRALRRDCSEATSTMTVADPILRSGPVELELGLAFPLNFFTCVKSSLGARQASRRQRSGDAGGAQSPIDPQATRLFAIRRRAPSSAC